MKWIICDWTPLNTLSRCSPKTDLPQTTVVHHYTNINKEAVGQDKYLYNYISMFNPHKVIIMKLWMIFLKLEMTEYY